MDETEFNKLDMDGKLWKVYELLSERSKLVVTQEIGTGKPENFSIQIEHDGRTYNKFKPCKYKCGGLTAWPTDYAKGDQPIHIHPTDHEILGFSEEGIDGSFHCPVVKKK